jgi:hypothetical protein
MRQSPAREFDPTTRGYAVEFDFDGVACRTLIVESAGEAGVLKQEIEGREATEDVEVVRYV